VRWVRPENLHLTLKFLGEVEESRLPPLTEALRAVRGDQFVDDLVTMLDAKVLDQSVQPTPKNG